MTTETSSPALGPHGEALHPNGGLGPHSKVLQGLNSGDTAPQPDPGTQKPEGPQKDGGLGPHS